MFKYFVFFYFLGLLGVYSNFDFASNSLSFYAFPILYFISFIYLLYEKFSSNLLFIRFSFLLLFLPFLSSLLSYDPLSSVQSLAYVFFNLIFVYLCVKRLNSNGLFSILLISLKFISILSLILFYIYPDLVIYYDPLNRSNILGFFNFKGLYPHKITAGLYNILGVILSLYFYMMNRLYFNLVWGIVFILLVLVSGSSLSVLCLIIFFIYLYLSYFFSYKIIIKYFSIILISFSSIIFILFMFDAKSLLFLFLGRDEGLTGRSVIWKFGLNYILEHPFLGSGFNVFFNYENPNSPAISLLHDMQYYSAPSFHNGFIQILAETGVISGSIFIFILVSTWWFYFKNDFRYSSSILILIIFSNFASSLFLDFNILFTFLVFYFYLLKKIKFINSDFSINLK